MFRIWISLVFAAVFLAPTSAAAFDARGLTRVDFGKLSCKGTVEACQRYDGQIGYLRFAPGGQVTEVYFVVPNPWKNVPVGKKVPSGRLARVERDIYGIDVVGDTYSDWTNLDLETSGVSDLLSSIYRAATKIRPQNQNRVVLSEGGHQVEVLVTSDEIVFFAK